MLKIRGLSLNRPWPFAFVGGSEDRQKRVENRGWFPPAKMMGHFLALHAAMSWSEKDREFISRVLQVEVPTQSESPHSQIFAVCRVVGIVTGKGDPRLVESQKEWWFGPFGWLLDDFVALRSSVTVKGAQGLWEIPANIRVSLRESYLESVPGGMFPTEPDEWEHPAIVQRRKQQAALPELSDWERRLQE